VVDVIKVSVYAPKYIAHPSMRKLILNPELPPVYHPIGQFKCPPQST
jgi:hypothetical protein